jgi:hypothetical protein
MGTVARIAAVEFGFGNVLAGTWCPEGKNEVYNCPVGSYCPDTVSKLLSFVMLFLIWSEVLMSMSFYFIN